MRNNKLGFTLLEILMVVLIIGVLTAIAMPLYQKAVLKSRFAALMPIGKSIADSNETYFLENNVYASNPQDLPVQGHADYDDGTQIDLVKNEDYTYTIVYNEDKLPDHNYIVFQKYSTQFPDTTMCEARDEAAGEVCLALGGTALEGGVTDGWTAYLLSGLAGSSYFPKECPAGGETQECDCGDPLPGTCDPQTGQWSYSGECPSSCVSPELAHAHDVIQQYDGIMNELWDALQESGRMASLASLGGAAGCTQMTVGQNSQIYSCGDDIIIDADYFTPRGWIQLQYCPGKGHDYWGCVASRQLVHAHSPSKPNYCVSYDSFGYEFCETYSDIYGTRDKRF